MTTKIKVIYHGIQMEVELGVIGITDIKSVLTLMTDQIIKLKN
jgi:hypothetical protein